MAKQPKFDTGAMIKSLKKAGVEHADAHTEAHAMASEHVYSKTEADLMHVQTTKELIQNSKDDLIEMYERFDKRTAEISKSLGNKVIGGTVAISLVITILIVVIELIHH